MNKTPSGNRQNILFITADQWRGECLSSLNHPNVKTPNLDSLADDGVLFEKHFCQSVPCSPSRASLYTGTYQHFNRVVSNGSPLDSGITNIAIEARKVGYKPILFGYTDVSLDPRYLHNNDPATRTYGSLLPGIEAGINLVGDYLPWYLDLKKKGYNIDKGADNFFKPDPNFRLKENDGKTLAPTFYKKEDTNTAFLVNAAMDCISVKDDPWFIHLSIYSPHPPFIVPEPYNKMHLAADMPEPIKASTAEEEAKIHPFIAATIKEQSCTPYTYNTDSKDNPKLKEKEYKQARATYYGMMSEVDMQLGRLFDYLKKEGIYDNTLIVFASDHGEQLGDHWQFGKDTYYEQSYKIPLIIKPLANDIDDEFKGKIISELTENIDVMPTILTSINAEVPAQCSGFDLSIFWKSNDVPKLWRKYACSEFDFRVLAAGKIAHKLGLNQTQCNASILRDNDYKYVHFNSLPSLLFNLKEDPEELNNLIDDENSQDIVLKYTQMMLDWRLQNENNTLAKYQVTKSGYVDLSKQQENDSLELNR